MILEGSFLKVLLKCKSKLLCFNVWTTFIFVDSIWDNSDFEFLELLLKAFKLQSYDTMHLYECIGAHKSLYHNNGNFMQAPVVSA